jgi:hypothetical protein
MSEIKVGSQLVAGRGADRLRAEVIGEEGRCFVLERWNPKAKQPRRVRFILAKWFLGSPSCGWKAV